MVFLRIKEEQLRKAANQPTLKELNKVWKQYHKQKGYFKQAQSQPKKVWEDIPLIMDKDEFFTVY